MDQEKIGKIIKELRTSSHLTQQEFAEKYGVTYQAVSKWENGKNIPDLSVLKELCKDYHISLEDFLEAKVSKKESRIRKIDKKKLILLLFVLVFLILGPVLVNYFHSDDFEMKPISSNCDNFEVSGSIAYNNKKSAIYISDISYCGRKADKNQYQEMKCTLYEVNDQVKKAISTYHYQENETITLEEFLHKVNFNIDDYSKTCKVYSKDSLNLEIEAVDIEGKTIFYKVPLSLEECEN